jgi:YVTN family beta-propeller protein
MHSSGDPIHCLLHFIEESQLILPYNFYRDIEKEIVLKVLQCIIALIVCTGLLFFGCSATEDSMEKIAYVANHDSSSVTVVDIQKAVSDPDNAVITTVFIPNSGEVIKGVAVSPDKKKVFVPDASYLADSLWIFSADDYSLTGPIHTGEYSVAVEVTPDGEYAYVLNNYENTVSVVSTETNEVVSTVEVGMGPQNMAFSPDGLYAYVTNKNGMTVSVIDTDIALSLPFASVVKTIAITADMPKGIAVTPDGNRAFVATAGGEGSGNTVVVLDLVRTKEIDTDDDETNGITPITLYESVEGAPRAVAITPDGNYAYVTNLYTNVDVDLHDTVSVIDTATYEVVDEIIVGDGPKGIAITSNGRYALVANEWGQTVSIIDLDTNEVISTIIHSDLQGPTWIAM